MGSIELNLTPGDDGSSDLVTVPPQYQEYLDGVARMDRRDFQFIKGLLGRFGVGGEESERPRIPFGRREFFLALEDLHAYGEAVRSLDVGYSNIEPVFTGDAAERQRQLKEFETREQSRPSAVRISDLCYLFLHVPEIKKEYMQIQAEKMSAAFPDFVAELPSLPTDGMSESHEYFVAARRLMNRTMEKTVSTYQPHHVNLLGWVVGYENDAYPPLSDSRLSTVAQTGNRTFTNFLEKVVTEVTDRDEGLRTRLRNEFLKRDGLGHRLMRTSLGSFANEIQDPMNQQGLDAARRLLTERTFTSGLCPATFKLITPEGERERPIAYEYASMIVGKMPRRLLQRR